LKPKQKNGLVHTRSNYSRRQNRRICTCWRRFMCGNWSFYVDWISKY